MITSRPEIVGTFGVVTSSHWLASAVGMKILEDGGNAFDAAVAAGFTLHVVEPDQNGPGGEAPIVLWDAASGRAEVICGQGGAPASATVAALRDLGLDLVPGNGHLPAVVPGAFGAWMRLLRDHGTLGVREVLSPAIGIARRGFRLGPLLAASLARGAPFLREHWPSTAAVYLPGGRAPRGDAPFEVPAVADTLERIVREAEAAGGGREAGIEAARRAWYEGFVAEAIDAFMREPVMDLTGEAHRGLLRGEDLARWRARAEAPVEIAYGSYTVCKPGPWSQGPVMLQQLALLEGFDLAAMDPLGAEFVHTVQECAKLAFADREAYYGDPDFADVPLARLLDRDYAAARRALVGAEASLALRPGDVGAGPAEPVLRPRGTTPPSPYRLVIDEGCDPLAEDEVPGAVRGRGHGDTCHLDVIDRFGNAVSATPSGGWLSGAPVVPGLGFSVSTRGQSFSLDEAHPNGLAPGKRPRTTLTPTLAVREDGALLAFGTPGGDQQDQWALHAFAHHLHHGMNLQQAVDAPAFHTEHVPSSFHPREWRPGHLALETAFPAATLDELARRGHRLELFAPWGSYSSVTMASRRGATLRAAASPRRAQCYAVGR